MLGTLAELDERDLSIYNRRVERLNAVEGVRCGDYVRFTDGVERRVSYITPIEWLKPPDPIDCVQTSDGGSWYLGEGYASFSGSLYDGVPRTSLTLTDETRDGSAWFFHHDYASAHNGVDVLVPFRVYECDRESTR